MINTAWISFDPMTNGQKLSGTIWDYMVKTAALAPTIQSRFGKAEFEIEQRSFGNRYKTMCAK
jgi:hypothetical protein